ncbi:hypothetical protein EZV62_005414 [Acer yangbiense]|uniref:Transmembrane protein n=1 Tax=Acer yangbiense TaxID=1000413 RepID=A0A5C7IN33_9ROSI|nr:hypothetical protein EZV62_005414 [Acer yangbiense]
MAQISSFKAVMVVFVLATLAMVANVSAQDISSFKAVMVVFVLATLAMVAHVSAQDNEMAPAPAPSVITGAGFSLPVSTAAIGFSLIFSLLAIFKQ